MTSPMNYNDLSPAQLVELAVQRNEGRLAANGSLVVETGHRTGRSPMDRYVVDEPSTSEHIHWGAINRPIAPEKFDALWDRVAAFVTDSDTFVSHLHVGADTDHYLPVKVTAQTAWHNLFANTLFIRPEKYNPRDKQEWQILHAVNFQCDPERDGTFSTRVVAIDMKNRIALVCGRADYCGVVKKSMFTVMNYLLPEMGHMGMHCSANIGERGDCAILFGLSGTGKTTLSADPVRKLIGDDEHAWTGNGVSNLEDGCYAKLINLDKEAEPVIAAALSMKGTIIENVPTLPGKAMEETDPQELDLFDNSITENTRFSYPLDCNPFVAEGARGPHPETIVLLTTDAFGVLPPVSILSAREVMYHFVSGFTAKLAGTEVGVTEPKAAFSSCFGAPFMSQKPNVYASLLAKKMEENHARCILLNTGWNGGPYGVGKRISIHDTRALLDAALCGDLHAEGMEYETHPVFNLRYPTSCPGVDASILDPRASWEDKEAYDEAAQKLLTMFRENFDKNG